jgi:hypothetical protein
MHIDLRAEGSLLKKGFLAFKWPIAILSCFIFALAFLMSKMHPEKVSYAKEYNYLYSIMEDLENETAKDLFTIKEKVTLFPSLHPEVDGYLIKGFLKDNDYLSAQSILEGVHKRVLLENSDIDKFSHVSFDMERMQIEKAYEQALRIKDNSLLKGESSFLYAYNLYRIFVLEESKNEQEKARLTALDLKNYIDGMRGSKNFENPLVQQIYKKINKES